MKTSSYKLACLLGLAASAGAAAFSGCAATPTSESTGQYVDDSALTSKVKAALLNDDQVKSFEIHVNTYKGVVQLSGFVDNSDERSAAVRDAKSVAGVQDVQDQITLK